MCGGKLFKNFIKQPTKEPALEKNELYLNRFDFKANFNANEPAGGANNKNSEILRLFTYIFQKKRGNFWGPKVEYFSLLKLQKPEIFDYMNSEHFKVYFREFWD